MLSQLVLLLCALSISSVTSTLIVPSCPKQSETYLIRNTGIGGLTFDGTATTHVEVQLFTGYPAQLWRFERGDKPNYVYIINSKWGKVLDVEDGSTPYLFLNSRQNTLKQQWILSANGRITNAKTLQNVEIENLSVLPGSRLRTNLEKAGCQAQQFVLLKK